MAHFYGSMTGQAKTTATRRGSVNSGMDAHIRGWFIGVRVCLRHVDGKDVVTVYRTTGSTPNGHDVQILEFAEGGSPCANS